MITAAIIIILLPFWTAWGVYNAVSNPEEQRAFWSAYVVLVGMLWLGTVILTGANL